MDTQQLSKYLSAFSLWFKNNKEQALKEKQEREKLSIQIQKYTKSKLQKMTEEDLFDYLSPLWAMAMWGNKHYQIDNIIEANGLPLLREQFANLIYGSSIIEKRWDEFRSKINGVGPATMSELLCKTYPDEFLLWNKKTYNGFYVLGISDLPRYEARLNGKKYVRLSKYGRDIVQYAKDKDFEEVSDMLTLNSFIWKELQIHINETERFDVHEELTPKGKKDALFVHNDIRDKIADIGRFLGFHAEVEKKIADGAIVDAIWDVTIGNMGRVIYVFEVQTAGSIDSLLLNLMKAKNNKAVQGIVAVTDQEQIAKIQKEIAALPIKDEVKFWDYTDVLQVHESLQFANESINKLGLIPSGY
jgi:hypothetical protein